MAPDISGAGRCRRLPDWAVPCRSVLITQRSQVQILPPLPSSRIRGLIAGRRSGLFDLLSAVRPRDQAPPARHDRAGLAENGITDRLGSMPKASVAATASGPNHGSCSRRPGQGPLADSRSRNVARWSAALPVAKCGWDGTPSAGRFSSRCCTLRVRLAVLTQSAHAVSL
jgi:hypothetical protein